MDEMPPNTESEPNWTKRSNAAAVNEAPAGMPVKLPAKTIKPSRTPTPPGANATKRAGTAIMAINRVLRNVTGSPTTKKQINRRIEINPATASAMLI